MRLLLVVLAWAGLVCTLVAQADADLIKKQIERLRADKFVEREAASLELQKQGKKALEQLKKFQTDKDVDFVARVREVIDAIQKKEDQQEVMTTPKVNLNLENKTLQEVLNKLCSQTPDKIKIDFNREPFDLPARVISIQVKDRTFWEALDQVLAKAQCSLRPVTKGDRMAYELVVQDGALPATPIYYVGPMRMRLLPMQSGEEEVKWNLEVLVLPSVKWSGAPVLQVQQLRDSGNNLANIAVEAGKPGSKDQANQNSNGIMMRQVVMGGGARLEFDGSGESYSSAFISKFDFPISLKAGNLRGMELKSVTGRIQGKVTLERRLKGEFVFKDFKEGKEGKDITLSDGQVVNLAEIRRSDVSGTVKFCIKKPYQDENARNFGMPFGGEDFDDGSSRAAKDVQLFDEKGRAFICTSNGGSPEQSKGQMHWVQRYVCKPSGNDSEAMPTTLKLYGPFQAGADIPFVFENVLLK